MTYLKYFTNAIYHNCKLSVSTAVASLEQSGKYVWVKTQAWKGEEELVQAASFSHLVGPQAPRPHWKHMFLFLRGSLSGSRAHLLFLAVKQPFPLSWEGHLVFFPSPHLCSCSLDEVDSFLLMCCGADMQPSSGHSFHCSTLLGHDDWFLGSPELTKQQQPKTK